MKRGRTLQLKSIFSKSAIAPKVCLGEIKRWNDVQQSRMGAVTDLLLFFFSKIMNEPVPPCTDSPLFLP